MTLSIDLYANDGSPLGLIPPDIHGKGVGGAELAMMTWAETMARRGHQLRIYNDPPVPGLYNGVEYLPQSAFLWRQERDVFITYRSPNPYTRIVQAAVRLFWSTDQYTIGNFATDVFPFVDRTICISPYHVTYHLNRYRPDPAAIGYFDLGVRLEEYQQEIEKVPGRCIFCSVPDRGLDVLRLIWPRIKEYAPHASLVITSDYTLWGAPGPLNHEHRLKWLGMEGVQFLGKVDRARLVQEQLRAEVQPYPCHYDELFCISAAECQVAGAYPVTTGQGALQTTNEWGTVLSGNVLDGEWQRHFAGVVASRFGAVMDAGPARRRFDWNVICGQWEHLIQTGEFISYDHLVPV